MKKETKEFKFEVKEFSDEGRFGGYLATFENVDEGGDLIERGAFSNSLQENRAFPLLWGHGGENPGRVVGTFEGKEDSRGLWIDGEFFLDQPGGQEAHGIVKKLYTKGIKVGLSIGYKAVNAVWEKIKEQTIRRIKEIKLFEGSLTLFPMNQLARIESIKSNEGTDEPPEEYIKALKEIAKTIASGD